MSIHAKRTPAADLARDATCPCGGQPAGATYTACCARMLENGALAPDAAALMRSRYTAYARHDFDYLRRTWQPDRCPTDLGQDTDGDATVRWLGLTLKRHTVLDQNHAEVEFVARYKIGGRAHRLHEVSRFIRVDDQWLYVDGDVKAS